jgi:hypothetical protein
MECGSLLAHFNSGELSFARGSFYRFNCHVQLVISDAYHVVISALWGASYFEQNPTAYGRATLTGSAVPACC